MDSYDVVIVGGGITGMTAAHSIRRSSPHLSVRLLEATAELGGIVRATHEAGHVVDVGPHGFIDNGSDTRTLVDELGLADELIEATSEAARIYMLDGPQLHRVPDNLTQLLRTPLLSWRGKLRLLGELFVPRVNEEESAVDFVSRRFGNEVAERFAVPAVRGVVGGDAASFSIDGEFPIIKELERRHGSVLVGAVRHQSQRRRSDPVATRLPSFQEFGRRLKTFRTKGMQVLVDRLASALEAVVTTGACITSLQREEDRWLLTAADGRRWRAQHVIVAIPTDGVANLVADHAPEMAALLSTLPHPDIRVLALGYEAESVRTAFPGIGFIASPNNRAQLLGGIHASTIFPSQAAEGQYLIRTLAGGQPDSPILTMSHDQAVDAIHDEIKRAFGITGKPVFAYDHLWRRPIPTYPVGYRSQVARLLTQLQEDSNLHLAGNSFFGVGVNDCVRDGYRAASEVVRNGPPPPTQYRR